MEAKRLKRRSEYAWVIEPYGKMRVPAVIYGDEGLIRAMDEKVCQQATNVAGLPGIVEASYAMPDAHWGYGFPIGGVAAFDAEKGGVISAGGVGFDIACGVRTVTTGLAVDEVEGVKKTLADLLARKIPAGLGSRGKLHLNRKQMDEVLVGGARWAVGRGYGSKEDLQRIEEQGTVSGADPAQVSDHAKKRQEDEVGTLGSGNHYMEVQKVAEVYDADVAEVFGIREGEVTVSIHCGSRGLGHQIATEFLKRMATSASSYGIELPERDLACAPINSPVGRQYLGAMRSGINCALANRQLLTHLLRQVFASIFLKAELKLLYDVSHNTCKEETHVLDGQKKRLFVHRKTMGTASYILVGTQESMSLSFGSSCHGAGRCMSRNQATRQWRGRDVVRGLEHRGILIRSPSYRGVAEEAPGAYKDVSEVVEAAHNANLSRKVAKLVPLICVKG
jgi:tRNA-splicing ligase RtcB